MFRTQLTILIASQLSFDFLCDTVGQIDDDLWVQKFLKPHPRRARGALWSNRITILMQALLAKSF